jgi:putative NADH-flavin reductase
LDYYSNLSFPIKILTADVFDSAAWKTEVAGASAVVSCIGAFGSNDVRKCFLLFCVTILQSS